MQPRIDLMSNPLGATIAKRIYAVSLAIDQAPLPKPIAHLVSLRTSQINGCGWCIDIHTKEATAAGMTAARLHLVAAWRHATVFTDAECAALALAEEGTRLPVSDATWAQARKHFDDTQLVALVALIAMINASNRMSVMANLQGGSYAPGAFDHLEEQR